MSEEMDRETAFGRLKAYFEQMPTRSRVMMFNTDRSFGFIIPFAITGFGFGEITLSVDKETGEAYCDLEEMSTERCGKIIEATVGEVVEDADDFYRDFYERNAE